MASCLQSLWLWSTHFSAGAAEQKSQTQNPYAPLYGIFTNIGPQNHPNVAKYTIYGAYGKNVGEVGQACSLEHRPSVKFVASTECDLVGGSKHMCYFPIYRDHGIGIIHPIDFHTLWIQPYLLRKCDWGVMTFGG